MYVRKDLRRLYYSERSSTRIFCPKFVLGHERARERAAILGSLTRCRDFVSVVPEPMENWNELTLHVSSKYIFNQQYYLAHHLFRYDTDMIS